MTTIVTPETRHFTASCVVFDPRRRTVLLIDHKLTGQRQFPGGHVDDNETGDQAAIREVLEETGVSATLWQPATCVNDIPGAVVRPTPIMICEFPAPADPDPAWNEPAHHHIDLLYLATADSAAPVTAQQNEVTSVVWLPLDTLDPAGVRPDVPPAARIAWGLLCWQFLPVTD